MRVLLIALFVGVASGLKVSDGFLPRHGIPPPERPHARAIIPTWRTIDQKVDNFDPLNQATWSMRYIENGQYFQVGGPIYIMLGAEWTIDPGWLQSGQMYDMAAKHNASMFYTEHRYYGASYPTTNLSTTNLKYLSVNQALADIANFIEKIKDSNPDFADSKVVVFGGSYGASLATWMRQKYPDLVFAAVASSAPLLAKTNFFEYHDVVKTNLNCSSILINASQEIRRLINSGNNATVEKDYNVCWPFKSDFDVQALFTYIGNTIGGKVQYAGSNTIKEICDKLNNTAATDYLKVAQYFKNDYCQGNFEFITNSSKNESLNNGNGRQWLWQTCTNFGFFQTAYSQDSLYNMGISIDYYHKKCLDVFGPNITREYTEDQVAVTNLEHKGLQLNVTRIISVHGTVDPWHALGVQEDINDESPTYVVNGTSHCADMYSLNNWQNQDMFNAKQAIVRYVEKWLQESF